MHPYYPYLYAVIWYVGRPLPSYIAYERRFATVDEARSFADRKEDRGFTVKLKTYEE